MNLWPPDAWDVLTGIGLIVLCYGLYLVLPALAFMIGGVLLMAIGVFGAMRTGSERS